jgi:hypothetical protein
VRRGAAAIRPRSRLSAPVHAAPALELVHERAEGPVRFTGKLIVLAKDPQLLFVLCQDLQHGVDGVVFLVCHESKIVRYPKSTRRADGGICFLKYQTPGAAIRPTRRPATRFTAHLRQGYGDACGTASSSARGAVQGVIWGGQADSPAIRIAVKFAPMPVSNRTSTIAPFRITGARPN